MKKCLQVLTVTLLGGSMLGCSSDNSSPSMSAAATADSAALDKAYVPALFYSGMTAPKNYVQDASDTLDRTSALWTSFGTTYADYKNWSDYYTDVSADFTTASDFYAGVLGDAEYVYPTDLTTAHDALETMRDTWSDMRSGSGINNYFFDKVTAAHHTMEPVFGAYMAFSKTTQQEADLIALQTALGNTLPAFSDDWDALVSNYGDGSRVADIYDFGTDKAAFLAANISGMEDLIASLSAVTETCNSADYIAPPVEKGASVPVAANVATPCDLMISYSSKIKGKFVPVFLAPGDFINAFMDDIIAANRALIPVMFCTGNPTHAKCGTGSIPQIQYYMDTYLNTNGSLVPSTWTGAMMNFGAHVMPILTPLNWAEGMNSAMTAGGTAWGIINGAVDTATIQTAHPEIEKISAAMYDMCAVYENQVTIMTRMGEYHGAFEAVIAAASDAEGMPLIDPTAEDVAAIEALMPALNGAFDNLSAQAAIIDFAAWGLTAGDLDTELAGIASQVAALEAALAAFDPDVANAVIVETALGLKAKYIPFFIKFGDFSYIPR